MREDRRRRLVFVVLIALAWQSATGPVDAIHGGAPPDAPEHGAVVSVHRVTKNGRFFIAPPVCSGTLISPTVVLTAAHCLSVRSRRRRNHPKHAKLVSPSARHVYVGNDPSVDFDQHGYSVQEVIRHPDFDPSTLANDIGLLRLSAPITEPVTPVPNLPASLGYSDADIGAVHNFAGFGVSEFAARSGVKLQVDLPLGGLGCAVTDCPFPGDPATQFSYDQHQVGPCAGDSGGPAFVYRDGVAYVGGVVSQGDPECALWGISTRVDAYEAFIDASVG